VGEGRKGGPVEGGTSYTQKKTSLQLAFGCKGGQKDGVLTKSDGLSNDPGGSNDRSHENSIWEQKKKDLMLPPPGGPDQESEKKRTQKAYRKSLLKRGKCSSANFPLAL